MWRKYGWQCHQKLKRAKKLKNDLKAASIFALFFVLLAWTGVDAQNDLEGANQAVIKEQPAKTVVVEARQPLTVEEKIVEYADLAFFPRETALRMAKCESSMNPYAQSEKSTAKGLYQFTDTTWQWIGAEGNQFDVDENIKQFIKWYPKYPNWWLCQ